MVKSSKLVLLFLFGCGQPSDPSTRTSIYDGVKWTSKQLSEEISGCHTRHSEGMGAEVARIHCKCVYIGLAQISIYEDFTADRDKYISQFEQSGGLTTCNDWRERKLLVDSETAKHALYQQSPGIWRDLHTDKTYTTVEIFY